MQSNEGVDDKRSINSEYITEKLETIKELESPNSPKTSLKFQKSILSGGATACMQYGEEKSSSPTSKEQTISHINQIHKAPKNKRITLLNLKPEFYSAGFDKKIDGSNFRMTNKGRNSKINIRVNNGL